VAEPVRASLPARIEHPTLDLPTREKLIVMVAVLLGLFLSALDQTIVGVALPRIVSDLKGSDLYTWVVTAYLLTSTITVPIYGKLGDVFGRQRMLIVGILIFLAGSALSGLSQSMGELIVFRAIQGCGAGALFPISLAVIGDLFTPRERGRYQGLFGAVFGVSFIVGPFLGGIITGSLVHFPAAAYGWHAQPGFEPRKLVYGTRILDNLLGSLCMANYMSRARISDDEVSKRKRCSGISLKRSV